MQGRLEGSLGVRGICIGHVAAGQDAQDPHPGPDLVASEGDGANTIGDVVYLVDNE